MKRWGKVKRAEKKGNKEERKICKTQMSRHKISRNNTSSRSSQRIKWRWREKRFQVGNIVQKRT